MMTLSLLLTQTLLPSLTAFMMTLSLLLTQTLLPSLTAFMMTLSLLLTQTLLPSLTAFMMTFSLLLTQTLLPSLNAFMMTLSLLLTQTLLSSLTAFMMTLSLLLTQTLLPSLTAFMMTLSLLLTQTLLPSLTAFMMTFSLLLTQTLLPSLNAFMMTLSLLLTQTLLSSLTAFMMTLSLLLTQTLLPSLTAFMMTLKLRLTLPFNSCRLPDHVSTEEGALLEPLSVAVHACNRADVGLGHKVLICGAGPIGLVNLLTAKARGAAEVCVTDIDQTRLDFAKKLGADFTLKVTKDPKETALQVEEVFGQPADITIECSGAPSSVKTAIFATCSGGCVLLVGMGPAEIQLPIVNAAVREVDIKGLFRYANCYPTALAMIASGKVDVKPLITHRFKLEQTLEAFKMAESGKGVKVMINCERK
ncbi:sorbitol dehydrogenase-like [Gigantopelta aegis]|uniref:sorbitol dehydrogenase-like n=1 Tax=Gigantopelta aegis TaxID=1735272 RepID=UPI001B88B0B5|nr:sorbitol dehydrogenase-like [Gigantopelta aegis]